MSKRIEIKLPVRVISILILSLLLTSVFAPVLADYPGGWWLDPYYQTLESSESSSSSSSFGYTSVETVRTYNSSITPTLHMIGSLYVYETPYGNYTWSPPGNIMWFTNFMGDRVIDESVFILQENSTGSWLALLKVDLETDSITTTDTYYGYEYSILTNKKVRGEDGNEYRPLGLVLIEFNTSDWVYRRPKVSVSFTKNETWWYNDNVNYEDFRWIWDIVPDEDWIYWKNDTLVDITTLSEDVIVNSTTQIPFTDNSSRSIRSILDVSDYGGINFSVGKTFWNSDGFVGVFPVNVADIDPIVYTQEMEVITPVDTTGWQEVDAGAAPADSVAEIVAWNDADGTVNTVAVRDTGEAVTKTLSLNEAEDGGVTAVRFLINIDGSGNIDLFRDSANVGYTLTGYWTGVTWTDQWVSDQVTSSDDDKWFEEDAAELTLQTDRVHLITVSNDDAGKNQIAGVRTTGSALERSVDIMEAEGGGVKCADWFVHTDAVDGNIEVYTAQYDDHTFINQGYFEAAVEFTEDWQINAVSTAWADWDISAFLDVDGRVCDFSLSHSQVEQEQSLGVRKNGVVIVREFLIREAEGEGESGYGMSVQTDGDGIVEYRAGILPQIAFSGYFNVGGEEAPTTVTTTIVSTECTTSCTTDGATTTIVLQTVWTVVLIIVDPVTTITQTSITQCVTSTSSSTTCTSTIKTSVSSTTTCDTSVDSSTSSTTTCDTSVSSSTTCTSSTDFSTSSTTTCDTSVDSSTSSTTTCGTSISSSTTCTSLTETSISSRTTCTSSTKTSISSTTTCTSYTKTSVSSTTTCSTLVDTSETTTTTCDTSIFSSTSTTCKTTTITHVTECETTCTTSVSTSETCTTSCETSTKISTSTTCTSSIKTSVSSTTTCTTTVKTSETCTTTCDTSINTSVSSTTTCTSSIKTSVLSTTTCTSSVSTSEICTTTCETSVFTSESTSCTTTTVTHVTSTLTTCSTSVLTSVTTSCTSTCKTSVSTSETCTTTCDTSVKSSTSSTTTCTSSTNTSVSSTTTCTSSTKTSVSSTTTCTSSTSTSETCTTTCDTSIISSTATSCSTTTVTHITECSTTCETSTFTSETTTCTSTCTTSVSTSETTTTTCDTSVSISETCTTTCDTSVKLSTSSTTTCTSNTDTSISSTTTCTSTIKTSVSSTTTCTSSVSTSETCTTTCDTSIISSTSTLCSTTTVTHVTECSTTCETSTFTSETTTCTSTCTTSFITSETCTTTCDTSTKLSTSSTTTCTSSTDSSTSSTTTCTSLTDTSISSTTTCSTSVSISSTTSCETVTNVATTCTTTCDTDTNTIQQTKCVTITQIHTTSTSTSCQTITSVTSTSTTSCETITSVFTSESTTCTTTSSCTSTCTTSCDTTTLLTTETSGTQTTTTVVDTVVYDGCVLDEFDDDALVAWYNNTHRRNSNVHILHDPEVETPDVILNVTGILDAGNIASVQTYGDADFYNVSEVVGDPGYVIQFNYTGLSACVNLNMSFNVWYDGGSGHTVNVQAWNWTAGAWVTGGVITEGAGFDWFNFTKLAGCAHLVSGGILMGRIYHDDSGNLNHDIYIDYIELQYDICPCGQVWSTNLFDDLNVTQAVSFRYNITIPTGGWAKAQFSQDNSTWVDSGNIVQWEDLSTGDNTILLTNLDWAGSFYYRVYMHKNATGTSPELDLVQACYSTTGVGEGGWNILVVVALIAVASILVVAVGKKKW